MKFLDDFILPSLTLHATILGLYIETNDNYIVLSHILLIFKYYSYISREKPTLNINILIANLIKTKKRANKHCYHQIINKRQAYKKLCITDNILPVT